MKDVKVVSREAVQGIRGIGANAIPNALPQCLAKSGPSIVNRPLATTLKVAVHRRGPRFGETHGKNGKIDFDGIAVYAILV